MKTHTPQELGTDAVRWDLKSAFGYTGVLDPQIEKDVEAFSEQCQRFHRLYKGNLDKKLGDAIEAYRKILEISNSVGAYLFLCHALDAGDEAIKTTMQNARERMSETSGEFLTFFELEIIALSEEALRRQAEHPEVSHHRQFLEDVRKEKPHVLSEDVEAMLAQISPFCSSSWDTFYDEVLSGLCFSFRAGADGEDESDKTLEEILHIISEHSDSDVRAEAMQILNDGLHREFEKLSAQTLNVVVGEKRLMDRKRKRPHPMSARNRSNKIGDGAVEALHRAVEERAAQYARRFYALKGAHLGETPLRWSSRNANLPFADTTVTPYSEAFDMVVGAYGHFSPTLSGIIKEMARTKRIDAASVKGKLPGAFNAPLVLPGDVSDGFTFLNYLGSSRDIMTLAHELGHAVHGILAGTAQGILMQCPGMAVAETASVFGEMTVFNMIKEKLKKGGNTKALLALVMGKLDDILSTSVRQISFSAFEQDVHGTGRRMSPQELHNTWNNATYRFYGEEGKIFTYLHNGKPYTDALWSYVPHFHGPFYVYAYAFGELMTHSLYAVQENYGEQFEPMYLDMLRTGNAMGSIGELLKPFGLDPSDPEFWNRGIEVSIGALLKEAEALSKELGVVVK